MKKRIALTSAAITLAAGTVSLTACGNSEPSWDSYAESVQDVSSNPPTSDDPQAEHRYADQLRGISDSPSDELNQATDDLATCLDEHADLRESVGDDAATGQALECAAHLNTIINNISTAPQSVRDAWGLDDSEL